MADSLSVIQLRFLEPIKDDAVRDEAKMVWSFHLLRFAFEFLTLSLSTHGGVVHSKSMPQIADMEALRVIFREYFKVSKMLCMK